jgi:hypothetical protein
VIDLHLSAQESFLDLLPVNYDQEDSGHFGLKLTHCLARESGKTGVGGGESLPAPRSAHEIPNLRPALNHCAARWVSGRRSDVDRAIR